MLKKAAISGNITANNSMGVKKMFLFFIGAIGFLASIFALIVQAIRKKPKKQACILVAVFFCVGIVGIATSSDVEAPSVVGKTDVAEESETETESPFIFQEITEGEVFESISRVWKNVEIEEVYDEKTDSTFSKVYIHVNEATPLDNAKKYLDIVSKISDNCSAVFAKADYSKVMLFIEVSNNDEPQLFYIELLPKNGQYLIEDYLSPDIISSLPDEEYREAFYAIVVDIYKQSCKKYTYKDVARSPQDYDGKKAYFTGKVIQVLESGDKVALRVNVTKGDYGIYKDTLYVYYERKSVDEQRILEDDIITMWGELDGLETYESVLGQSISIPKFNLQYYKIEGSSN